MGEKNRERSRNWHDCFSCGALKDHHFFSHKWNMILLHLPKARQSRSITSQDLLKTTKVQYHEGRKLRPRDHMMSRLLLQHQSKSNTHIRWARTLGRLCCALPSSRAFFSY